MEKQVIEYWFNTNLFGSPVHVKIRMIERDEAKAKELFEEMFQPVKCNLIERPTEGKFLLVNEVWDVKKLF